MVHGSHNQITKKQIKNVGIQLKHIIFEMVKELIE